MIALRRKGQGAKANLSTKENPPKKGAWFSNSNENSRWTEGIETQATQGSP